MNSAVSALNNAQLYATDIMVFAQDQSNKGPMGPEFGKAGPMGLFVIVLLTLVILLLGFNMNKRIRRMERRKAFADKWGIDLFDEETLEAKMKEEGFEETVGRSKSMYARTEVPQTDARFLPSSGTLKGPDAIDAERTAAERKQTEHDRTDNGEYK